MEMDAARARQEIEQRLDYEETKRLLVKLVQTPSPQTELLEKEPRVLYLIRDVVRPELESEGIRTVIDDMGNLTARLPGKANAKGLVLVSYAMNAAPSTMPNPYSGEIVDGGPYDLPGECVWGRGACEQKGSLAAMLMAMKLIARSGWELPGALYFVTSTAGESGKHESLDYVLSHDGIEAQWGIIDGPPEIQLGNKGRIDVRIMVRGRQAHSSRPWDGINAVEGAVRVLQKLGPLMPYPEEKSHPDLGRVSLAPTAIESFPRATHTLPGECHIRMDRRLLPGDDADRAVKQLSDAIWSKMPPSSSTRRRPTKRPKPFGPCSAANPNTVFPPLPTIQGFSMSGESKRSIMAQGLSVFSIRTTISYPFRACSRRPRSIRSSHSVGDKSSFGIRIAESRIFPSSASR